MQVIITSSRTKKGRIWFCKKPVGKMILGLVFSISLVLCLFDTANAVSQGTVRFYRNGVADTSQSWSSGIVQIYYYKVDALQWGNICDDVSFGSEEADVICHQLGYSGASSFSNTGATTTWGSDDSDTLLDDVSCSGSTYLAITQCAFSTYISTSTCDSTKDAVVSCYSDRIWASPSSGDIRLTGGAYSNQGLLEVYCNGQWGTVCNDDSFSPTQAQVACAQLGYNYYTDYAHLTQQGTPSQPIFLRSLSGCFSSDDCLTQCGSCPSSGISSCTHDQDITLECVYSASYSKRYTRTTNDCDFNDNSSISTGALVGAVIVAIIICIVCIALAVGIPVCICICLGVGIGAAVRSGGRSRVAGSYKPQHNEDTGDTAAIVQQSAYYPSGTDASTTAEYPKQPPPMGYSQQPVGYPQQPVGFPQEMQTTAASDEAEKLPSDA